MSPITPQTLCSMSVFMYTMDYISSKKLSNKNLDYNITEKVLKTDKTVILSYVF